MQPAFVFTIDDGHPLDLKTADLLNKHGLSATFFIPIRNCEGDAVMEAPDIRHLAQRFEVGSHTLDHRYLKSVDVWRAYHQVNDGKKRLEDVIGIAVNGFCYPGGRYRKRDVELVRACGFTYARTTMNLRFDAGNRPFEMPTTIQFYPHDPAVYVRNFIASGNRLQRLSGLRLALAHSDWIRRIYALFDHACATGGVFHLWAHSKQIEQLAAWPALDAFLAHVGQSIPRRDCLTNEQLAERMGSGGLLPAGQVVSSSAR